MGAVTPIHDRASNGARHAREAWEEGPPEGRFANDEPSGVVAIGGLAASPATRVSAAELVRARIGTPPARRIATGIGTLDTITRNGLPEGKVVLFGGAPGAGKTTAAVQFGLAAAKADWAVLMMVADGSTDDVLQRIAQLEGFTRDEWEANDREALELFAERIEGLPLQILDTDSCNFLEEASDALRASRGSRPSLLVVDSVQTVRSLAGDLADAPRARLDANTNALKRCARADGHLVIATSELSRGAYRNKSAAEQIDDLAAFKESGALEYAADLALVLRSVKDDEDAVDVTVPKSRIGAKTPFRLRLDRRHMRFSEEAIDLEAEAGRRDAAIEARADEDGEVLARFLVEHPGVRGVTDLRAQMRASGVRMSNDRLNVAIAKLGNRIENRSEKGRPRWFLRQGSFS